MPAAAACPALLIERREKKILKVTTERLADCQIALIVEPDNKTVQDALRRAARMISRNYNVPGFRKGKAPYAAVLRAYGKEVLYEQVGEEMREQAYKQALEEIGLKPIGPGSLEDVTFDPLVFRYRVPMPPEIDLGDYRSARVEAAEIEVSDEEIAGRLAELQEVNSEWVPLEGEGAQYDDLATMRLKGSTADETIIEEDAFELQLEEGGETFPPGFDGQFIGQTAGAFLSFDLTYPEDWPTERAGKDAHFEAEILSIKRYEAPALDDDFAPLVGDYDTLDDLKQSIREGIISARKAEADNQYVNDVLEKIVESAVQISYPSIVLDDMIDRLKSEQEREMQRIGLPLAEYLRILGQDEEQYRERFRNPAEAKVRGELILDKLAELEHIQASDDEIDERMAQLLDGSDDEKEEAALRTMLSSESGRMAVGLDIVRSKTIERLREIGLGTAPELPVAVAVAAEPGAPAEVGTEDAPEAEVQESEPEPSVA